MEECLPLQEMVRVVTRRSQEAGLWKAGHVLFLDKVYLLREVTELYIVVFKHYSRSFYFSKKF